MLSLCGANPFLPHRALQNIADELDWWSLLLQSGGVSKPIYPTIPLTDPRAFSDASLGIGMGIVIGNC